MRVYGTNKITITDVFLGEIELTKVAVTYRHIGGESKIDTIYEDEQSNIWIDTWSTVGCDDLNLKMIRKEVIDEILLYKAKSIKKILRTTCYCGKPVDLTNSDCVDYNLCKEHAYDV